MSREIEGGMCMRRREVEAKSEMKQVNMSQTGEQKYVQNTCEAGEYESRHQQKNVVKQLTKFVSCGLNNLSKVKDAVNFSE